MESFVPFGLYVDHTKVAKFAQVLLLFEPSCLLCFFLKKNKDSIAQTFIAILILRLISVYFIPLGK